MTYASRFVLTKESVFVLEIVAAHVGVVIGRHSPSRGNEGIFLCCEAENCVIASLN